MIFNLEELAAAADGRLVSGDPKLPVPRLVIDSRAVRPGDFFVALKDEVVL